MDPTLNPEHMLAKRPFCLISSMPEEQQQDENTSSESDNDENLDVIDPILAGTNATNARANLSVPTKANTREKQETHVPPREHMRGSA